MTPEDNKKSNSKDNPVLDGDFNHNTPTGDTLNESPVTPSSMPDSTVSDVAHFDEVAPSDSSSDASFDSVSSEASPDPASAPTPEPLDEKPLTEPISEPSVDSPLESSVEPTTEDYSVQSSTEPTLEAPEPSSESSPESFTEPSTEPSVEPSIESSPEPLPESTPETPANPSVESAPSTDTTTPSVDTVTPPADTPVSPTDSTTSPNSPFGNLDISTPAPTVITTKKRSPLLLIVVLILTIGACVAVYFLQQDNFRTSSSRSSTTTSNTTNSSESTKDSGEEDSAIITSITTCQLQPTKDHLIAIGNAKDIVATVTAEYSADKLIKYSLDRKATYENTSSAKIGLDAIKKAYTDLLSAEKISEDPFTSTYEQQNETVHETRTATSEQITAKTARIINLSVDTKGNIGSSPEALEESYKASGYTCTAEKTNE